MSKSGVISRLRELGHPTTLFGESEVERSTRLKALETSQQALPVVVEENPQENEEVNFEGMTEMEKKFYILKNKMKKIGDLNLVEVANEEERKVKKRGKRKRKKKKKGQSDGMNYSGEQAELDEYRHQKRQKVDPQGWDMYSDAFKFRMHQKRCKSIGYTKQEYLEKPKNQMIDDSTVSEEAKERMARDLKKQAEKREKFNRRRTYFEDENVSFISERNRNYNKKLAVNYDKYRTV